MALVWVSMDAIRIRIGQKSGQFTTSTNKQISTKSCLFIRWYVRRDYLTTPRIAITKSSYRAALLSSYLYHFSEILKWYNIVNK